MCYAPVYSFQTSKPNATAAITTAASVNLLRLLARADDDALAFLSSSVRASVLPASFSSAEAERLIEENVLFALIVS